MNPCAARAALNNTQTNLLSSLCGNVLLLQRSHSSVGALSRLSRAKPAFAGTLPRQYCTNLSLPSCSPPFCSHLLNSCCGLTSPYTFLTSPLSPKKKKENRFVLLADERARFSPALLGGDTTCWRTFTAYVHVRRGTAEGVISGVLDSGWNESSCPTYSLKING